MDCHFHFQGIFLTQGSNQDLLHYKQILCQLSYQGSPTTIEQVDIIYGSDTLVVLSTKWYGQKQGKRFFFFLPSRSKNASQINEISLGLGKYIGCHQTDYRSKHISDKVKTSSQGIDLWDQGLCSGITWFSDGAHCWMITEAENQPRREIRIRLWWVSTAQCYS